MKTKVIFRKFKEGDVIALFPELAGTNDPYTCLSYQHLGQHGAASVALVYATYPALPHERSALWDELEYIGYELEEVYRFTQKHLKARRQETERFVGRFER